ncbi:MAG TPA: hypothetical protein VGL56_00645 [Fimbriimonadaceae bacterium]|jgi:hypothetical protein
MIARLVLLTVLVLILLGALAAYFLRPLFVQAKKRLNAIDEEENQVEMHRKQAEEELRQEFPLLYNDPEAVKLDGNPATQENENQDKA